MKLISLLTITSIAFISIGCQTQEETKEEQHKLAEQIQKNIDKGMQVFQESLENSGLPKTLQNYSDNLKQFSEEQIQKQGENAQQFIQESINAIQNELEKLEQSIDSNATKARLEQELKKLNDLLKTYEKESQ